MTDGNGEFSFLELTPGEVVLRAGLDGYASVVESLEIASNEVGFVQLRLPPLFAALDEIFVIAEESSGRAGYQEASVQNDDGQYWDCSGPPRRESARTGSSAKHGCGRWRSESSAARPELAVPEQRACHIRGWDSDLFADREPRLQKLRRPPCARNDSREYRTAHSGSPRSRGRGAVSGCE